MRYGQGIGRSGTRGRSIAAGLAVAAVALVGPATAGAAPGELDTSFGFDGRYFADIGTGFGGGDIAIDSEGRVLTVFSDTGDAAGVIRVLPDGGTDESFGTGGIARSAGHTFASRVAVDGLDRVVVAAYVPTGGGNFAAGLVRFNASGDLDDDFDGNGTKGIGNVLPFALEARPDGKILYQGDAGDQLGDALAVVQLNDDGSRNTSFGTSARAVLPLPAGAHDARVMEISIGPDGNVAVLGEYTDSVGNPRKAIGMLTAGGDLDTGFAGDGVITSAQSWEGVAAVAGGGLVATRFGSQSTTFVARYGSDGQPDPSFGDGGGKQFNAVPYTDFPLGVDIGPAGQIAVTGTGSGPDETDFFSVTQLTPEGQLDTGFGENSSGTYWDLSGRLGTADFDPAGNIVASQASVTPESSSQSRWTGVRLVRLQGSTSTGPDDGDQGDQGGVAGDVASSGRGIRVHKIVSPRTFRGLALRGTRVLASCQQRCRAVVSVRISEELADFLGLPRTLVARGTRVLPAGKKRWVRARYSARALRALNSFQGSARFKIQVRGLAP